MNHSDVIRETFSDDFLTQFGRGTDIGATDPDDPPPGATQSKLGRIDYAFIRPGAQPGSPAFTNVSWMAGKPTTGAPVWFSIFVALVYSAVLGLIFYYVVVRPLRHAPVLARVCASVGFMLYLETAATLGSTPISTEEKIRTGRVVWSGPMRKIVTGTLSSEVTKIDSS